MYHFAGLRLRTDTDSDMTEEHKTTVAASTLTTAIHSDLHCTNKNLIKKLGLSGI